MDTGIWIHLLTLLSSLIIVAGKDYYELLGVKRDATDKEIKRRFRQLALQYHPDKNKDPKAEETFRAISEAYDVLIDPKKRQQYNAQGHEFYTSSADPNGFSSFHFNMNDFNRHFDTESYFSPYDEHDSFAFPFDSIFDEHDGEAAYFTDGNHYDFADFFGGFDGGESIHMHTPGSSQQNCRTVTRREGNSISTFTECY
ncbi:unnamed protein product [Adineta ricciae]|uniref:DnaJ homolog subfamily B member 9 n=1 Tax=Adineta ricciae TaxID=249248 RepID=A0A815ZPE7_ADIRI|nr:unnamed protein product [Adineta ricciae]